MCMLWDSWKFDVFSFCVFEKLHLTTDWAGSGTRLYQPAVDMPGQGSVKPRGTVSHHLKFDPSSDHKFNSATCHPHDHTVLERSPPRPIGGTRTNSTSRAITSSTRRVVITSRRGHRRLLPPAKRDVTKWQVSASAEKSAVDSVE
jgi:hypothetical protein